VVNSSLVDDSTIQQPGFKLPQWYWTQINHFRTNKGFAFSAKKMDRNFVQFRREKFTAVTITTTTRKTAGYNGDDGVSKSTALPQWSWRGAQYRRLLSLHDQRTLQPDPNMTYTGMSHSLSCHSELPPQCSRMKYYSDSTPVHQQPTTFNSFGTIINKYVSGYWPLSTHADPTSTCSAIFHKSRMTIRWIGQHTGKERKRIYIEPFIYYVYLKALRQGSHSFTCKYIMPALPS